MSLPVPAEQTHPTHTKYRADIDGLRAIAVIAVIINHYFKDILPSGYLGVDIFFVISGYVITSVLINWKHLSFRDFILDFYQRRIKRLLPALVFCVAITSLAGFLFIPSTSVYFVLAWRTGISALFGFSNIYLFRRSTDYFGNSAELNLFTHTWSLGVEEQFYVLFPILVWLAGFSRQKPSGPISLFYWVGGLSIASLVSFVYLSGKDNPAAYFMMTSRFWELGAGCLIFLISHKHIRTLKPLNSVPSEFFFVCLIAALFIPLRYQIQATTLVVLLTVFLIATINRDSSVYKLLTLKPIVFIGLISYSLYLWHWSVLVISRWTIGLTWWLFPIQLAITFALAIISYRYIESPLRRGSWSSSKLKTIYIGLAVSTGCAALLVSFGIPFKGLIYSGNMAVSPHVKDNTIDKPRGLSATPEFAQIASSIEMQISNCNMTPHHLGADNGYQPKPTVDQRFISKCLSGSKPKIILIGDSFAQIMSTRIAWAAKDSGYDFKTLFGYGCPYPLDLINISNAAKNDCEIEPDFLKTGLLENINPGDIVVLRLFFQKTQYITLSGRYLGSGELSAYDREIDSLYHAIIKRGGSLLLIGSNPSIEMVPACDDPQWFNSLQRASCTGGLLYKSELTQYAIRHDLHLLKKFENYPHFEFISPTRLLCDKNLEFCPLQKDGSNLYATDRAHLSQTGMDLIYPDVISGLHRLHGPHRN